MDPEHERIIRIGVSQLRDRGFVLGGSQAFNAYGLGTRQAHGVDLFTDDGALDIDSAVADVRQAYESAGYRVDLRSKSQHFARMTLTGSDGRQTELDMGLDYREQPPVEMDFGPPFMSTTASAASCAVSTTGTAPARTKRHSCGPR
ncbi:MAG TPA: hypothetical protein VGJ44_25640 [Kribbellaceae bacterium]